jgi:hypothetical protein
LIINAARALPSKPEFRRDGKTRNSYARDQIC